MATIRPIFFVFFLISFSFWSDATVLVEKREPTYFYSFPSGSTDVQFSSPQSSLDGYQALLSASEYPKMRVFNPHFDPSNPGKINDLLVSYLWDFEVVYLNSPSSNYGGTTGHISMHAVCPEQWTQAWKQSNENAYDLEVWCERRIPIPDESARTCRRADGERTPFPIVPATGEKYRSEVDWVDHGPEPLSFERTYRSGWGADDLRQAGPMGKAWTHNYASWIKVTARTRAGIPIAVAVLNSDGAARTFIRQSENMSWVATNGSDTLVGSGPWTYFRAEDDMSKSFNSEGLLLSELKRNGLATVYAYDDGNLRSVTNAFGRTLTFNYNSAHQLVGVNLPDSRVINYLYDGGGRLSGVTYPDGKTRAFTYQNRFFPHALTGINDESGIRWASFRYSDDGRAFSSELAGGASKYEVTYPFDGAANVVDPLRTSRFYKYESVWGRTAITQATLPSGLGEADAASRVQDSSGLIIYENDFNNVQTATSWDVARRLPISTTRASATVDAQTTFTQWHPIWALPVLVTESGRTTAYTYDTQGRTLSRTVTHTNANSKTQTTNWTYTARSLVATETAPNGAVTSYSYDTQLKSHLNADLV